MKGSEHRGGEAGGEKRGRAKGAEIAVRENNGGAIAGALYSRTPSRAIFSASSAAPRAATPSSSPRLPASC